jgi:putative oxidoreductase
MIDQRTAPYAALLLRSTLGSLFIAHLYWKFAIRGFDLWWASLQGAGYPTVVLLYVLCAEFAGALRYLALMSRIRRPCPAAQARR